MQLKSKLVYLMKCSSLYPVLQSSRTKLMALNINLGNRETHYTLNQYIRMNSIKGTFVTI